MEEINALRQSLIGEKEPTHLDHLFKYDSWSVLDSSMILVGLKPYRESILLDPQHPEYIYEVLLARQQKIEEWENFYNFSRPHGAFDGLTPYEILRERLQ